MTEGSTTSGVSKSAKTPRDPGGVKIPQPAPVAVLPLHHQISQKLHACTEPGNQRAHDLIDLQLIVPMADDALVAETVKRLFDFRGQHAWPASVTPGPSWDVLHAEAAEGLETKVRPTIEEAVKWINLEYIPRLVALNGGLTMDEA